MSTPAKKVDGNICKPLLRKEDFDLSFSGEPVSGCPELNLSYIDQPEDVVAMMHCVELGSSYRVPLYESYLTTYEIFTKGNRCQAFFVRRTEMSQDIVALIELYMDTADKIQDYREGDYLVKFFMPESIIGNTKLILCSLLLFIKYCKSFQNVRGVWIRIDEDNDREVIMSAGFTLNENEDGDSHFHDYYISLS